MEVPNLNGPGANAKAKTGKSARENELIGMGGLRDPSNVAGLMVIGSLGLLIALNMGFGGLTVSIS